MQANVPRSTTNKPVTAYQENTNGNLSGRGLPTTNNNAGHQLPPFMRGSANT